MVRCLFSLVAHKMIKRRGKEDKSNFLRQDLETPSDLTGKSYITSRIKLKQTLSVCDFLHIGNLDFHSAFTRTQ